MARQGMVISGEVEVVGKDVVDAAFKVHRAMGPGLLENVYEECIFHELSVNKGLNVEKQAEIAVCYNGHILENKLRIDLLVEKSVVLELKSVEKMQPIFEAQLLTYLKLTKLRLGYLINFNVDLIKHGIKRMVL